MIWLYAVFIVITCMFTAISAKRYYKDGQVTFLFPLGAHFLALVTNVTLLAKELVAS